jgi:hypothetical protein
MHIFHHHLFFVWAKKNEIPYIHFNLQLYDNFNLNVFFTLFPFESLFFFNLSACRGKGLTGPTTIAQIDTYGT